MLLGLAVELLGLSVSASRWLVVNSYYGGCYLIYGPQKDPVILKLEQLEQKITGSKNEKVDDLPANSCWLINTNNDCRIEVDNLPVGLETISHWMKNSETTTGYQLVEVNADGEQKSWRW